VGTIAKFARKTTMINESIIAHFLPIDLLEYFSITEVQNLTDEKTKQPFLKIHLEEKNSMESGIDATLYESKGFTEITLQDFPIRGKAVYLVIKRRRWRNKTNEKEIIKNVFPFVSDGSKLTKELSDFLKYTSG
jgi:hypothetical protein